MPAATRRSDPVAASVLGKCEQHQDPLEVPVAPTGDRLGGHALQESDRVDDRAVGPFGAELCQQDSRQRDVFELSDVAEVVVRGEASLPDPRPRLGEEPVICEQTRSDRRDRPDAGGEIGRVDRLGGIEQSPCAGDVTVGGVQSCTDDS